ncbi:hypothetical protein MaudCBS49596_003656 [Microsporum audouinii]
MEEKQQEKPGKPSEAKHRQNGQDPSSETSTSASMAGRIQSSAAGLLRSAISPPSSAPSSSYAFARDVSSSLASVSSSDKGAASSASASTSTSATGPAGVVDGGFTHRSTALSGFRSQRPPPEMQSRSEREFHLGGLVGDGEGGMYDVSASKGKARQEGGEERFDSVWKAAAMDTTASTASRSFAEQERMDGQAVSDLLSSASFDPLSHPDEELELEPELETEPDAGFLTAGQQQPSISSTSLIPDIDFVLSSLRNVPPQSQPEHLRDLPGVAEWLDLNAEYHDVVWGHLKPCVEEARREVQERSEKGEQALGDGPAVARLRMVLAHIKERKMP